MPFRHVHLQPVQMAGATAHPVHLVSYISYPLIIKEAKWPHTFCTSKGGLFSVLCLLQAITYGLSHEKDCLFYSVLCYLKLLLLILFRSQTIKILLYEAREEYRGKKITPFF